MSRLRIDVVQGKGYFFEFIPEWFDLPDRERSREMTILVCLCGELITPPLTAGAGPQTWQTICRLLRCLGQAQAQSNPLEQAKTVLQAGGITGKNWKLFNRGCGN